MLLTSCESKLGIRRTTESVVFLKIRWRFETLEDKFDEFLDRLMAPRSDPVLRDRINYMETLDDADFRTRFRLTKEAVTFVYSLIESAISVTSER